MPRSLCIDLCLLQQQQTPVPNGQTHAFSSAVANGGIDGFSRVTAETGNDARRHLVAEGEADEAAVGLQLSQFGEVPVRDAALDTVTDTWRAPMLLRPSAHPYGLTAWIWDDADPPHQAAAQTHFTLARRAALGLSLDHNEAGQVTQRTWADGRAQALTWDAAGRLTQVIEFKVPATGDSEPAYAYRWTALYDGLGRRVRSKAEWGSWSGTEFTPSPARPAVTEDSWYDPLVEFLEIAVETKIGAAAAEIAWKVHGPDANGVYGGLQGIGGLEAVYTHAAGTVSAGTWTGVIDDYYGHVVAYVDGEEATSTTLHWQRTRSIGYGPAPDSPVFYVSEGASVVQATAWRGKRQDISGFYYLGARYYEPTGGRFLAPDPFGHGASMSLYDYAGGDPINFLERPTQAGTWLPYLILPTPNP